jgi:release factor glutamine methyltransferase
VGEGTLAGVRLVALPGVFRPISDSWMLAGEVREQMRPGARALDLCTGSGLLAIAAAQAGAAESVAIDVSRRSVLTVRLNARLNGVRVRALRGDLTAPVRAERFDVIASNPPYVPAAGDALPDRGPERAWDAGRDGRALLDRVLAEAPPLLAPGGALLVVHSDLIGEEETLARMRAAGLDAGVVVRRRGPLGPLMRACAEAGLLPAGTDEEEVLVFRATRPRSGAAPAP